MFFEAKPELMKTGTRTLESAREIAEEIRLELDPHCHRIAIAGSIRRCVKKPGDIEIVCIPKDYGVGLFESGIATVIDHLPKITGELPCKWTQRTLPSGMQLDLFMATPDNWGLILAIRTGNADFSRYRLACTWVKQGYRSKGGVLYDSFGDKTFIREERDLFAVLGMKWVEPQDRS